MIDNILDQLKRDEGLRLQPYSDTRGFKTIGYGHNLDANPLSDTENGITEDRAAEILENDLARITDKLLAALPWAPSLEDAYKGVLQNMSFNMGVNGLLAFHHMLSAVESGDYGQAAQQMVQSAWYNQVGARAKRLVTQMATGVWQ